MTALAFSMSEWSLLVLAKLISNRMSRNVFTVDTMTGIESAAFASLCTYWVNEMSIKLEITDISPFSELH